jgi:allantoate deiminase
MAPDAAARAAGVMARCDELAACSEQDGRITRRVATPALEAAMERVAGWMREAGMSVRRDALGTRIGRYEGARPDAPALLLGSHLDSVPDAGRYDGPLGVLAGIACVERLAATRLRLPFAVEVLAFADEEGVRFGAAYLGSRAHAGTFERAWLQLRDDDGTTLAEALAATGGDAGGVPAAARSDAPLGYVELHIEQGPVLESAGLAVGVVTGICGQTRVLVEWRGASGHAGTVPMALRRDALAAAAELLLAAEALARGGDGLVATVGRISIHPGAANVICGRAAMSLDVRHADDGTRRAAVAALRERCEAIAAARGVEAAWTLVQETPAVPCAPELRELLERAVSERTGRVLPLASGAGHDAAALAGLCPVAMLFVRCRGGISHHPDESVAADDVAVALEVLDRMLELASEREAVA